jgi:hypothetical protein
MEGAPAARSRSCQAKKNRAGVMVDEIVLAGSVVKAGLEEELDTIVKLQLSFAYETLYQFSPGVDTRCHDRIFEAHSRDQCWRGIASHVWLAYRVNMAQPTFIGMGGTKSSVSPFGLKCS